MILTDLSQIAISNIMMSPDISKNELDDDVIKFMILNSLKALRQKFFNHYGEIVICCDHRHSWRKAVFEHYKASRKKDKDNSYIDWNMIYDSINAFKHDLREHFPYKVIEVFGAEADDVIATLAKNSTEDCLIISSDKDYAQLQSLGNVKQYCPKKKEMLEVENAALALQELIVRGDRSDGIPNVRSDDDSFVTDGKRQKPITAAIFEEYIIKIPDELKENKKRNNTLINFDEIPPKVSAAILEEYTNFVPKGDKSKMYNYFVTRKMKSLLPEIGKFL